MTGVDIGALVALILGFLGTGSSLNYKPGA